MNFRKLSESPHIENWRLITFIAVIGMVFFIMILRLFILQVVQHEKWVNQAEENRTDQISIRTHRGVIYDRNGILLARNIASYNVAITPALMPDDDGEVQEIIRELSQYLTLPIHRGTINDPLIQCGDNLGISEMVAIGLSFAPYNPVLIECDIKKDLAMAIQEKAVDWPGVTIEVEPIRDYPTGELTSTVIGFLGPIPELQAEALQAQGFVAGRDKVGYAGIELYFDELMRGKNGLRTVEVDVAGEVLRDVSAVVPPQEGLNLVLTLDMRLQQAADAVIKDEINFWNTYFGTIRISSGVVIAMNPQTGEVLAMVSWPTYENNRLARIIPAYYYEQLIADATQPLLNHAAGAELPAGSVFKIVTSVGSLNEGVVTPDQIIETPPEIVIQNIYTPNDPGQARTYPDWNPAGFGQLDFVGGIANSSNVYFYKLGGGFPGEIPEGLGICRLGTYARALGFASLPGIELPDETDGLIPDPTWKRINQGENWSTGDTYLASVGQGFVIASPLQVLMSAAVVANDGVLMRPTLVREIMDDEGKQISIVMDQNGNVLEHRYDENGNLSVTVYDETGEKFDLALLDVSGNALEYPNQDFYNEDGDPLEARVISPWAPDVKWDLTQELLIEKYSNPAGIGACKLTGEVVSVEPWVFQKVQEGMRAAVTRGTLEREFTGFPVPAAGKTGTAEYCDQVALENNRCIYGNWPTHAWTVAYAPYDDPEIAVVAFLYNGGEGASVAAPVVRRVLQAYFELKAIDATLGNQ